MSVLTPLPTEKQTPDDSGSSSRKSAFTAAQLIAALPGALRKLDPRQMWRNPVMFIVEIGAAYTTVLVASAAMVAVVGVDMIRRALRREARARARGSR